MRIERKVGATVAVLGSLLLAVSGTAPAFAHTGHSAGLRFGGLRLARVANSTSTTFAGWVFGAKAAAGKSVTSEFKVPTLKCTSTTSGIGPLNLLVTGTGSTAKEDGAGILLACQSGKPAAEAAVLVDNTETNDTTNALHPGDLMKATIVVSTTTVTATIADLTAGHTFTFKKSGKGGTASQEAIVDFALANSSGTQLPVVNFGKIVYSKGAVGGKALGSVKPQVAVNMQTSKGVLQILTGQLSGTTKNAFTTTFKHS